MAIRSNSGRASINAAVDVNGTTPGPVRAPLNMNIKDIGEVDGVTGSEGSAVDGDSAGQEVLIDVRPSQAAAGQQSDQGRQDTRPAKGSA